MYKDSKWAKEILALQDSHGLWGYFHTLSEPNKHPITTEQALRRLCILGYTIEDEPIQRAVHYMNDCLCGKKQMPDRREKLHDWDIFTDLMLSTWIRKFTAEIPRANEVANMWSKVITEAFCGGRFDDSEYVSSYKNIFGIKPAGGRLVDFVSFYQVSLIAGLLDGETENAVFDHILGHENGIYYIYDRPVSVLPTDFASKQASRYLGAVEILSAYRRNTGKLEFVVDWLDQNRNENGKWDMGGAVNDKVYFPLSDSWRRRDNREKDCTFRIDGLIKMLTCPIRQ